MRPIFVIHNNTRSSEILANQISALMKFEIREINIIDLDNIGARTENEDTALLIIGINNNKDIQFYLNKLLFF